MKKTIFHISKMDCPSEERIIRLKLEEDLSIKRLTFDIPNREMTAFHLGEANGILEKLLPLNFGTSVKTTENSNESDFSTEESGNESRVLKLLLVINAGMFFVELILGIFAESMGLISDSFDMFADASVYMISLYAVGKALHVKQRSAKINGILQMVLGFGVLLETVRRFIYGSEPEPNYMIFVSLLALAANVYCLFLLSSHKDKGVHMKASYICSSTDVMANTGVIVAGLLVMFTHSNLPDLCIGLLIAAIVFKGALAILKIAK